VKSALPKPLAPSVTVTLLTSLLLFAGTPVVLSAQILLPRQSGTPGASILGQVEFSTQTSVTSGVQFDVTYDNSQISLTGTLGGPAITSGKSLYAVDLASNQKRFLIVGSNQNVIPDGTLMNLSVTISPAAPAGTYALKLSNVFGTDPEGNPVLAVTGSDGVLTVSTGTSVTLQYSRVLNAGSFLSGPVAPGELITLSGSGIGPASVQQPTGSSSSTVLGGTSVLFDGAAAPLLYASPNQINAIVPYSVPGNASTELTVTAQGQTIASATLATAATAPAVFTLNSTGTGPGAILNQDSTVNSQSNPASRGSVISIFASGAGQTSPPSIDGQITGTVLLPTPILPVSVQIGGLNAKVLYAGAAPELISGVVQVNALVPSDVSTGPAVPVLLTVGEASSQAGVVVAIR
jgi:uncharacterized protein (TIGR03437 family)